MSSDVNFEELARCTDDFNGAQLKAVCVEAGMIALRRGATELIHEDYMDGEEFSGLYRTARIEYWQCVKILSLNMNNSTCILADQCTCIKLDCALPWQ